MQHAADFLAHLLPKQVFDQLRDFAQTYERDEAIRVYLLRRMWFVIPMGILFFVISGAIVVGGIVLWGTLSPAPSARWVQWTAFIIALLALVGGTTLQLYWLLSWLAKAALRSDYSSSNSSQEVISRRNGNEILWISLFVVIALGLLAFAFPPMAAALALLVILAPVIYTLVDR